MASGPDQEKPNPYTTANPISKLFFREWNKELYKDHPSLGLAMARVYGMVFAFYGIFAACEETIRIIQPVFLGYLIDYFSPDTYVETWQAYVYAAVICFLALLLASVHAPYFFACQHLGMQARIGLCTLVYRKMLKLSNLSLKETSGGQINNLMTNDVNRFDRVFALLHYLWLSPLQLCIVGYLLYQQIKLAFIPGYLVLFLLIPTQAFLGRIFGILRRKTASLTDKRVNLMSEIIVAMRVIKMYAWEQPFEMVLQRVRKSETAKIFKSTYPLAFNACLALYGNRLIDVFMIITYTLTISEIKASTIFVIIAYCNTLRSSFARFFPQAIQLFNETGISLKRLQTFLLLAELESLPKVKNHDSAKTKEEQLGVTAVNLQGSWESGLKNPVLQFVNFDVPKNNLMAVIGPVGSGKSSLLMALLKELPTVAGKISVGGRISYVSQEPWIFNGTVRKNILFGRKYMEDKYKRIIQVCALDKDILQLADGDMTMVGERGVTLSGGQKARVNLARALYDDADIYLLDDPLSAVDSEVGRHIFDRCIMGYLADKPRILVTHQLQFLNAAQQILVLNEGIQEAVGTLNELQSKGIDFAKLLNEDEEDDENDEDFTRYRSGTQRSRAGTRKSRAESIKQEEKTESAKIFKAEEIKKGDVEWLTYLKYFKSGTNLCGCIILLFFLLGAQVVYILADYWLAYWADTEEAARLNATMPPETSTHFWTSQISRIMTSTPSYLDNDEKFVFTTKEYAFIYGFLVALLLILGFIRAFFAFRVMVNASKNLHNEMFKSTVRSPMLFFDTNPTGRILNRFTNDIGLMDDQLPTTFLDFTQLSLLILGVIIVNIIVNPFIILLALPLTILFVYLRRYALVTTRFVKRLDGVTRSPVFSHTTSSLKGLWVIRSYHKQHQFNIEFNKHQDRHSEAWFMFLAATRWFGYRLDLMMVVFICGITFAAVPLANYLEAGLVGLILSNTLSLANSFQYCVRQSALVENQMTSVERVMEYCQLEPEAPLEIPKNKPSASWPQSGYITFKSVSLAYSREMPVVLKDISCQIYATEKIGVVGRTGAGKSSLITALFRLAEPQGIILIDAIWTSSLGLHDLRRKLSIIPQDPVLFTGTLRYNLDPFGEHKDGKLWKALREVQLHQVVQESLEKLEMEVGEAGSNFSVGQRQLICLARAILKHNRILILDEATANVDPRTDALIQETIRTKFRDCTVLTIAHRLNTIMDSDRIMVLDNGELKEFDQPYTLLQDKTSMLSKLAEQTGKGVAAQLMEIAQEHYQQRQQNDSTLLNGSAGNPHNRSHEALPLPHHSSPEGAVILREPDKVQVNTDENPVERVNSDTTDSAANTTLHQKLSGQESQECSEQETQEHSEEALAFENIGFDEDENSGGWEEEDEKAGETKDNVLCSNASEGEEDTTVL